MLRFIMIMRNCGLRAYPPSACLLHPLKLFEVVVILKFLHAKDKIGVLSRLNKKWQKTIREHYAWSAFPKLKHPQK